MERKNTITKLGTAVAIVVVALIVGVVIVAALFSVPALFDAHRGLNSRKGTGNVVIAKIETTGSKMDGDGSKMDEGMEMNHTGDTAESIHSSFMIPERYLADELIGLSWYRGEVSEVTKDWFKMRKLKSGVDFGLEEVKFSRGLNKNSSKTTQEVMQELQVGEMLDVFYTSSGDKIDAGSGSGAGATITRVNKLGSSVDLARWLKVTEVLSLKDLSGPDKGKLNDLRKDKQWQSKESNGNNAVVLRCSDGSLVALEGDTEVIEDEMRVLVSHENLEYLKGRQVHIVLNEEHLPEIKRNQQGEVTQVAGFALEVWVA